ERAGPRTRLKWRERSQNDSRYDAGGRRTGAIWPNASASRLWQGRTPRKRFETLPGAPRGRSRACTARAERLPVTVCYKEGSLSGVQNSVAFRRSAQVLERIEVQGELDHRSGRRSRARPAAQLRALLRGQRALGERHLVPEPRRVAARLPADALAPPARA